MPNDTVDLRTLRYSVHAPATDSDSVWKGLKAYCPDPVHLDKHRIVTQARRNPASGAFDLLRTRLLNTMEERGWTHLGIVSPTSGCGKTFVAGNLGFSLARQRDMRTLLCDMDLRSPGLTRSIGLQNTGALTDALRDADALERHVVRLSDNFAVLPNDRASDSAAEALYSSRTRQVLARLMKRLQPDIVIYDLPPALICDDILAFRYQLDAVLLVTHGEKSTAQQIRTTETLLDGEVPIIATVLNEAADAGATPYYGAYG